MAFSSTFLVFLLFFRYLIFTFNFLFFRPQALIGDTIKEVTNQLINMNLSTTNVVLDTRTPPKVKQQMMHKHMEKESLENSHAGVAIPVDEETLLMEEATKKTVFYKIDRPTTDSGLSTWILLSSHVDTVPSTSKPIRKSVIKPNLDNNKNSSDLEVLNKVVKPMFKKRLSTTKKPMSSSIEITTEPNDKSTKLTKVKASVLSNAQNKNKGPSGSVKKQLSTTTESNGSGDNGKVTSDEFQDENKMEVKESGEKISINDRNVNGDKLISQKTSGDKINDQKKNVEKMDGHKTNSEKLNADAINEKVFGDKISNNKGIVEKISSINKGNNDKISGNKGIVDKLSNNKNEKVIDENRQTEDGIVKANKTNIDKKSNKGNTDGNNNKNKNKNKNENKESKEVEENSKNKPNNENKRNENKTSVNKNYENKQNQTKKNENKQNEKSKTNQEVKVLTKINTIEPANFTTPTPDSLPLEAKEGETELMTTTQSNKKTRRTNNKRKKNKVKKTKRPNIDRKDTNVTKVDKIQKDKPIGTQIYNYLAREVMPTVGVGLVGLMVTAGLASYFFYPFGGLRRSYEIDRKDKAGSYYYSDYTGGVAEEEMIGKVIAGMPDKTLSNSKSYSSRNGYPSTRYRNVEQRYTYPQGTVETIQISSHPGYTNDEVIVRDSYVSQDAFNRYDRNGQYGQKDQYGTDVQNDNFNEKEKYKQKDYSQSNYYNQYNKNQFDKNTQYNQYSQSEQYNPNGQFSDQYSQNVQYNQFLDGSKESNFNSENKKFVVGNVPKELLQEVTPAAVPEHGPRSMKIRRKRNVNDLENEIPLDDSPPFKLEETSFVYTTPKIETTTIFTTTTDNLYQEQPSLFNLFKDLLNLKLRLGLELLQNTTQTVSRYLARVQERLEKHGSS